ncbi:alpha/beta hydrolase [Bacillus sp. AK128]
MKELEITIPADFQLKGTIAFPDEGTQKLPAVLIIAGSGKVDRNGRVSKKIDLQVYRQMAHFITQLGFVTLRYDKRGVGESSGNYIETGLWDLVDDAKAAIQFLKNRPEVDANKVIVLGHSEGTTIGTAVAVREPVSGLILLAGAGEKMEEALFRQREIAAMDMMNAKGFLGWYLRLLGAHKKVEKQAQKFTEKMMASNEDVMKIQFQKINAKWFREHFDYDVREDLTKVDIPVLGITGARDIQANPDVVKNLPNYVLEESEYHVIENMGHSLKFQAETSNMFTIKKDLIKEANLPIHPDLEAVLKNWLDKHFMNR